jgi:hypothetical protein
MTPDVAIRRLGLRALILAARWGRVAARVAVFSWVAIAIASAFPGFFFLPFAVTIVRYALFPVHSVEHEVKERGASISLAFYMDAGDGAADSEGQHYLTVRTPKARVSIKMCGLDWPHSARTSLYLVGDRDFAVVGAYHCDYLITTDPPGYSRVSNVSSENWIYLGAFDLVEVQEAGRPRAPRQSRELQFIPASEQEECIEMHGETKKYDWAVRNEARKNKCPTYRISK